MCSSFVYQNDALSVLFFSFGETVVMFYRNWGVRTRPDLARALLSYRTTGASTRIAWCSCIGLRGQKHGYGEHTA